MSNVSGLCYWDPVIYSPSPQHCARRRFTSFLVISCHRRDLDPRRPEESYILPPRLDHGLIVPAASRAWAAIKPVSGSGVILDPGKCQYPNADAVEQLPQDLAAEVSPDDQYLFQTALSGGAGIIVTSGKRLVEIVKSAEAHGIQLRLRDEFIAEYVAAL